ncbi:MAG: hypothetical protein ACRD19_17595 [Terriglobia bacterium]
MAFNKSKALEEAARLVSQRKLPQAIKQYQTIIDQDPQDLPLRNIVGDLWVREGNAREAVREFHALAEAYTSEGFTLKAIAIYKKIVKLDTESPDPLIRLAELYAGQKFSHEANEQYAQALAVCERHSLHDRAGQILRKLVAHDPENTVYQTRLGEFLQRSGQPQEACQVFLQAAEIAYQRQNISGTSGALKKAAELEPQNPQVVLFRARLAAEVKDYAEVERIFHAAPGIKSDAGGRGILLGVYLDSGRFDDAAALAAEAFREGAQGLAAVKQFVAHCLEAKPGLPTPTVLHLFSEIAGLAFERNQTGEVFELLQKLLARHPPDAALLDSAAALCERAGQERAPASLLETMGKGFGKTGQWAKAERAFRVLAGRNPANAEWQASLMEAIEKQGRAASGEPSAPLAPSGPHGLEAPLPPSQPPLQSGSAEAVETHHGENIKSVEAVEVDFSAEWETFAASRPAAAPPDATVESSPELASEPAPEIALEMAPEIPQQAAGEPAAIQAENSAALLGSPPHDEPLNLDPILVEPDLSEEKAQVEFYLNSGFLGEADTRLRDLAARHPGRAEILELQDRLQAASVPMDEPPGLALDELAPAGPPAAPDEIYELSDTNDTNEHDGTSESNEPNEQVTPLFFNAPDQLSAPALAESQALAEEAAAPRDDRGPEPPFQPGSLLGDLAQELALALEETQVPATEGGAARPGERGEGGRSLFDSSLEELLTELESGQPAAPAEDTPQTHYNLGVAFREMGLLDEAIGEFQKVVKGRIAADHPPRFLEASSMLGNCFMEKQMPEIAARWYSRALQVPGLEEEIVLALTYDLAAAHEKSGNLKAAQEKFSEVYSMNIDYRDVSEKIQLLSRSKPA